MKHVKQKIAFLIHDLRDGGVERVTVSLANGISSRGIDVDLVLVNRVGKSSYFDSIEEGVRITNLRENRTLTSIVGFRRYLNESKPDVVISALTHINVATILARVAARHRPRLIVVEHNQMSKNIEQINGLVRLAYATVPWIYRQADLVGAVSEGVKADLIHRTNLSAERISVLHNPVVTSLLKRQSCLDSNHPWFEQDEPPVVLGVGRLIKQKNFKMLIEAFALLRKERRSRLMILGDGPDRAELERLAQLTGYGEDIAFLGFVDNPFAFMRQAAIFALSSDWEGLPTVLIEAMACGAAVVSTDCPSGPSEILLGGEIAPLTPPGNTQAFSQALSFVLSSKKSTAPLVARADDFSVKSAVDRYLEAAFPALESVQDRQRCAS